MRYLRTNTAVLVTVGPFYDVAGLVIETALTITNERITLVADTDAGSAPTLILDNITGATSGTANDLNYITNCDAGLMQLELAAADVNRLGRMFLTITDAANHVPVFHEFTVLPAQVYDSLILGTDLLDASAAQLAGTTLTGRDIGASVLLSSGTGTGQVSLSSGTVTTGAISANAISATAIASNAIAATKIATGAITNAKFAAGAIDAAAIATDAIAGAKVAADAVTKIQNGLATPTNITAGTITTVTNLTNLPAAGATAAELAKVPKSDSNVTWNATALASINTQADTALSDYDPPTNAEMEARTIAAAAYFDPAADTVAHVTLVDTTTTNTDMVAAAPSAAANADAVWDELKSAHTTPDTFGDYLDTEVSGVGGGTAADIADAVWDEAISGHLGAGTTGEALNAAGAAGDPWTTAIPGAYGAGSAGYILGNNINAPLDTIDTNVDAILADTNEVQAELADGGRTDLLIDAILADTNELQTDDTPAAFAALNDFDPAVDVVAHVTLVDTTTTNTDMRGTNSAALASAYTSTRAGYLDELAAANIPADLDAVLADTNELQTDDYPTSIAAVKGDTAAILIDTADMQPKLGTPAGASMSADIAAIEAQTDDIGAAGVGLTALASQASINALNNLSSAQAQTAAAAALTAYDPPTAAELTSGLAGLNDLSAAEVNAEVVDVLRTDLIPDSYSADGAQPTIAQALLEIRQFLTEFGIVGTTITVNKPDGTTAAMTFTLDDGTTPTALSRAT